MKRQLESYLDKKYVGKRANKRPDLLLNANLDGGRLLREFKRPSHPLSFIDYQQATAYRNDFRQNSSVERIAVILLGGKRGRDLQNGQDGEPDVKIVFKDLIATAR